MNFKDVWDSIQKTGGATFSMNTGELNPTVGFAVGQQGGNKIVPLPTTFEEFMDTVRSYLAFEARNLDADIFTDFMGFWVNDGKLVIDTVKVLSNLLNAIENGVDNRQLSIFDLQDKKVIQLFNAELKKGNWYIVGKDKVRYDGHEENNEIFCFYNEFKSLHMYSYKALRASKIQEYVKIDHLIANK